MTIYTKLFTPSNFDLCCLFVDGSSIQFTPPFIPTLTLPYFQETVRRLYLSATLTAQDAFLRTFGTLPNPIIAPRTTAGECERMILIPAVSALGENEEISTVKEACLQHKALILVPSARQAEKWSDYVGEQSSSNVTEQVETFKLAGAPAKLLLKARYDGVDLPGDACRVMIIDELPKGIGTLERYLWEKLGMTITLRSTVASRIVQSFGRISRGMSDYGVVFLTSELLYWILTPSNRSLLPPFLQNQFTVGLTLSKALSTQSEFVDGVVQCLRRDDKWLAFYKEKMGKSESPGLDADDGSLVKLATAEAKFAKSYWQRDFTKASEALATALDQTFAVSAQTGAWHSLWLGYCYDLLGNSEAATDLYTNAHRVQHNIPPIGEPEMDLPTDVPNQIAVVSRYLIGGGSRVNSHGYRNLDRDTAALNGLGSAPQTEQAVLELGLYLGLISRRPEKEQGTGPDVIWTSPEQPLLCMELKTGKDEDSTIWKKDVGQLHNHVEWCRRNLESTVIIPAFVGSATRIDGAASPSTDTVIVSLEKLGELRDRLRGALEDISQQASVTSLQTVIFQSFKESGLLWPELIDTLQPVRAIEK